MLMFPASINLASLRADDSLCSPSRKNFSDGDWHVSRIYAVIYTASHSSRGYTKKVPKSNSGNNVQVLPHPHKIHLPIGYTFYSYMILPEFQKYTLGQWEAFCLSSSAQILHLDVTILRGPCAWNYRELTSLLTLRESLAEGQWLRILPLGYPDTQGVFKDPFFVSATLEIMYDTQIIRGYWKPLLKPICKEN